MTLTSLDIGVIMTCDEIQLGPFDYVVTHMYICSQEYDSFSNYTENKERFGLKV